MPRLSPPPDEIDIYSPEGPRKLTRSRRARGRKVPKRRPLPSGPEVFELVVPSGVSDEIRLETDLERTAKVALQPLTPGKFYEEKLRSMAELMSKDPNMSFEEAADMSGVPRRMIQHENSAVRAAVREYIMTFRLPPEIQRELVRAARTKVLLDSLQDDDRATALKASDAIASDPDVGLRQAPVPLVNLDFSALTDLLEKISDAEETETKENENRPEDQERNVP